MSPEGDKGDKGDRTTRIAVIVFAVVEAAVIALVLWSKVRR